jgi:autotransporter-associated beta strand protein
MKPKFRIARHLPLASAITIALLGAHAAQAATYHWDNNATTAGFGNATGTWAAPTANQWSTDSSGLTTPGASITTATTDALNFGTATAGLAAGTIAVSGTVSAGNMTFGSASGDMVLSGGTLSLAATQTTTVDNTSDTISSILGGAGTSFTKAGTGTLTLAGDNTYSGATNVSEGTLTFSANRSTGMGGLNVGTGASGTSGTLNIQANLATTGGTLINTLTNNTTGIVNVTGGAVSLGAVLMNNSSNTSSGNTGRLNISGGAVSTNYPRIYAGSNHPLKTTIPRRTLGYDWLTRIGHYD